MPSSTTVDSLNSLRKMESRSQKRPAKRQRQPPQARSDQVVAGESSVDRGREGHLSTDVVEENVEVHTSVDVVPRTASESSAQKDNIVVEVEISEDKGQERINMSVEMESAIQEIRQRMDNFTEQVCGLLEEVKNFFTETVNAFEDRLVQFHESQIESWQEEIRQMAIVDCENEEAKLRLRNAQELLGSYINS